MPWQEVIRAEFPKMPAISIDVGVMEKSDALSLIPADVGWSDLLNWDVVHGIANHDENGNDISGNVLSIDCHGSLIRSEKSLIAAVGVENIIAVETQDAILLCRRGDSRRVAEIINHLKEHSLEKYHLEHLTVNRPWGNYTILEDSGNGYKIKRIEVLAGASLSLQAHHHRSEHWVVVSGTATITCGDWVKTVARNGSAYIPVGVRHRIENRGKILLQLIEVQVGDYLEEDDIQRFQDNYGRV